MVLARTDSPTLTAALEYLEMGFAPIPLEKESRKPVLSKWQTDKLSKARLEAQWRYQPEANVGLVMGLSGLIGLDIDGPVGIEILAEWAGGHDKIDETWAFETPNGGKRLLYRLPAETNARIKQYKDEEKNEALRILVGRSQTVMPPSKIRPDDAPETLREYVWCHECRPGDLPLADCPAWLLTKLEGKPEALQVPPDPVQADHVGVRPGAVYTFPALPTESERQLMRASAYLAKCEPAVSGQGGHNATYRAACKLVGQFQLTEQQALELLLSEFNPRCQPPWSENELRHKVVSALAHHTEDGSMARQPPAPNGRIKYGKEPSLNGKKKETPAERPKPNIINAKTLEAKQFEPIRFAIKNLIPEGVTVIAGRPKSGKSFFILQACMCVAAGWDFLGETVVKGDVLYLALEDDERRLQRRMATMNGNQNNAPEGLDLAINWQKTEDGGVDAIRDWIKAHPTARMIAIDTLAKVKEPRKGDKDIYAEDYEVTQPYRELAKEFQIAIVLITHTRKPKGEPADPLDEVQSSTGLTGAVEAVLVLKRQRMNPQGKLFVTGRDVEEQEMPVRWESNSFLWSKSEQEEESRLSEDEQMVLSALTARRQSPMSTLEIVGLWTDKSRSTVDMMLSRMVGKRLIERAGRGRYKLPEQQSDQ